MEIKIQQQLKSLRKEKGNTQEDLAQYLGISVQAVSNWERGDGMPDICLLPKLSAYYGVRVDTLLGVDEEAKNKRIQEITDKYNALRRCKPNPDGTLVIEHNIDEGIEIIRDAVREFPDCWFFLQLLASDLWWKAKSVCETEKAALLSEAENLCDKIMKSCTENRFRNCASSILCMIYINSGKKDKALENAWESPDFVDCTDWKLTKIFEGGELKKQLRRNIREFMRLLYLSVKQMQDENGDFQFIKEDGAMKVQFQTIQEIFDC